MDFNESQTKRNLMAAFAGESQARNKYTYYASQAKKEGFVEISKTLEEIANNEKEHAKIWFKLLHNGSMPDTQTNLKDCQKGEHEEHTRMYPEFAQKAREEGFNEIADLFEKVAAIEAEHEQKFLEFSDKIEKNIVFKDTQTVAWVCLNCGHVSFGEQPPETCPVCAHPKGYFSKRSL